MGSVVGGGVVLVAIAISFLSSEQAEGIRLGPLMLLVLAAKTRVSSVGVKHEITPSS